MSVKENTSRSILQDGVALHWFLDKELSFLDLFWSWSSSQIPVSICTMNWCSTLHWYFLPCDPSQSPCSHLSRLIVWHGEYWQISVLEATLNHTSEPWSGEASTSTNAELNVEHENRTTESRHTSDGNVVSREVKSARKNLVANKLWTMNKKSLDHVIR